MSQVTARRRRDSRGLGWRQVRDHIITLTAAAYARISITRPAGDGKVCMCVFGQRAGGRRCARVCFLRAPAAAVCLLASRVSRPELACHSQ